MGPAEGEVFSSSLSSSLEIDLEHDVLDSKQLLSRLPGYQMPAETMALYQPQGGLLVREWCVTTHVELGDSAGCGCLLAQRRRGIHCSVFPTGVGVCRRLL